jgi:hypothetical protein
MSPCVKWYRISPSLPVADSHGDADNEKDAGPHNRRQLGAGAVILH